MSTYHKIALILASDYPGTTMRLRGCVNDANSIKQMLIKQRGFTEANIKTYLNQQMTRTNILAGFDHIVEQTKQIAANGQVPAVFLHYSGHGLRMRQNGDNRQIALPRNVYGYNDSDGDEAIVPQDVNRTGIIRDDEINARLIKRLHPSTQLFALTDCCNSGTNLDLAYQGLHQVSDDGDQASSIIHLAGCQDWQLSAEVNGSGLTTKRFLEVVGDKIKRVADLRRVMADLSIPGNVQHPQVSVSKRSMIDGAMFPWIVANVTRADGQAANPVTHTPAPAPTTEQPESVRERVERIKAEIKASKNNKIAETLVILGQLLGLK